MDYVKILDDGLVRCAWGTGLPEYVAYHDFEWGRPSVQRSRLFEKLCLEGFQSGLSWLTILRKRAGFREAFADFVPETVAAFEQEDVDRLLENRGIVRHQGKIRSAINNARQLLALEEMEGDFGQWIWKNWADASDQPPSAIAATTEQSTALARALKKAGFTFVGPTTVYAFMQSMGLVNDHYSDCYVRDACQKERLGLLAAIGE
ncbi:MAG TPA: DNA-3-methyladenine glycosylase I [Acidimicrobiia bacterium]|nr:DNA-3-methyladenine glycosylase I [Acidimicrobiia bacterium]